MRHPFVIHKRTTVFKVNWFLLGHHLLLGVHSRLLHLHTRLHHLLLWVHSRLLHLHTRLHHLLLRISTLHHLLLRIPTLHHLLLRISILRLHKHLWVLLLIHLLLLHILLRWCVLILLGSIVHSFFTITVHNWRSSEFFFRIDLFKI